MQVLPIKIEFGSNPEFFLEVVALITPHNVNLLQVLLTLSLYESRKSKSDLAIKMSRSLEHIPTNIFKTFMKACVLEFSSV